MFEVGDKVKILTSGDDDNLATWKYEGYNVSGMYGVVVDARHKNYGWVGVRIEEYDDWYWSKVEWLENITDESEFDGWEYDWERVPKGTMCEIRYSNNIEKALSYFWELSDKHTHYIICSHTSFGRDKSTENIENVRPLLYADRRLYRKKVEYVQYDSSDHLLGMEVILKYNNEKLKITGQDMNGIYFGAFKICYDDLRRDYDNLNGTPCGKVKK